MTLAPKPNLFAANTIGIVVPRSATVFVAMASRKKKSVTKTVRKVANLAIYFLVI